MALVINSNVQSLSSQRNLTISGNELAEAQERLSSGRRINSAADDAAGLSISNRLTSQINGLNQAVRNANDGVSLIQTAEGALDETTNILQRVRELSIQSANGIFDGTNRATLNAEVTQLVQELDRIAETTSFNGQSILDGSLGQISLQVGANANQTIDFSIDAVDSQNLGGVNADVVGSNIVDADLSNGLAVAGDVTINNQVISASVFTGATNGNELVAALNSNLTGVEADLFTEATGTAATEATGILTGSDNLTLTVTNGDGTSTAFTVANTNSLADLANEISTVSAGALQGTVVQDENGQDVLNVVSQDGSAINISGTDAAITAAGFAPGAIQTTTGTVAAATAAVTDGDSLIFDITAADGTTSQVTYTAAGGDGAAGSLVATLNTALGANATVQANATSGLLEIVTPEGVNVAINAGSTTAALTGSGLANATSVTNSQNLASLTFNDTDQSNGDGVTIAYATAADASALGINARTANSVTGEAPTTFASPANDIAAGDVFINGVDIGAVAGAGSAAAQGTALATAINNISSQTGVSAAADGSGILTLTGNDIEVSFGTNVATEIAALETTTGLQQTNAANFTGGSISEINISTQAGAQAAIGVVDRALEEINQTRGDLGAVNNRLDFTVNNLSNIAVNSEAARSRILDADFAAESANLSRAQVLQQAGQTILAQANAAPQQVLSLLQ